MENISIELRISGGSFAKGFFIRSLIFKDGQQIADSKVRQQHNSDLETTKEASAIPDLYRNWCEAYKQVVKQPRSITNNGFTIPPQTEYYRGLALCTEAADALKVYLNEWLNRTQSFRFLKDWIRLQLTEHNVLPNVSLPIVFEISGVALEEERILKKLPWHLWDLFIDLPNIETVISATANRSIASFSHPVRIMAIFGNAKGIHLEGDLQELVRLSNEGKAQVVVLLTDVDANKLNELRQKYGNTIELLPRVTQEADLLKSPKTLLNEIHDQLTQTRWDILFFAGHSYSTPNLYSACLVIGRGGTINLDDLLPDLQFAVQQGLKLAIFNSCDGLEIAERLTRIKVPTVVIFREPVPDQIANDFLKEFLRRFSQGEPFYQASRQARQNLQWRQGDRQDPYPSATWLPVIYQHYAQPQWIWPNLSSTDLCRMASESLHKRNYNSAISNCDRAIELDQNCADAYYNRGLIQKALRAEEQALADFQKAKDLYEYQENLEGYEKARQEIRTLRPTSADLCERAQAAYQRALVSQHSDDYNDAISAYSQAIESNQDWDIFPDGYNLARAYHDRGLCYDCQGNNLRALEDYRQAIEINPKYASAYFHRGMLSKRDDKVRALEDLRQAARLYSPSSQEYRKTEEEIQKLTWPRFVLGLRSWIRRPRNLMLSVLAIVLGILIIVFSLKNLFEGDATPNFSAYGSSLEESVGDNSSIGENWLIPERAWEGDRTDTYRNCLTNFSTKKNAVSFFTTKLIDSLINFNLFVDQCPIDPEARIYLNNIEAIKNIRNNDFSKMQNGVTVSNELVRDGNIWRIAVVVPAQGNRIVAGVAQEILRGVAQAQTEINQRGGIDGKPLQVQIVNDTTEGNAANRPLSNLTDPVADALNLDPAIVAVLGHYTSTVTKQAGEKYAKTGLVLISPTSTATRDRLGSLPNVFRVAPTDEKAAEDLNKYVQPQQEKLMLFYEDKSIYSKSLKDAVENIVKKSSSRIITSCNLSNELAFDSCLSEMKNQQMLFLFPSNQIGASDRAYKVIKQNTQNLPILAGDAIYGGATLGEIEKDVKESFDGIKVAIPWHVRIEKQRQSAQSFLTRATDLWKLKDQAAINWRTAMAYDATQALYEGLRGQKPNFDRKDLRNALLGVKANGFMGVETVNFTTEGDRDLASLEKLDRELGTVVEIKCLASGCNFYAPNGAS